ncbi:hypothetical protein G3576_29695 [Roseomonas stagni]|uniref:O-antigen/teichoic acid export membrane protein n=1 Tax=Falsiroseomonas algicola TaxID=2716930 RepID=A0A6M1LUQ0_9PROT|nr:hypothetical protein [Falsiroseomonas algicola]NGM24200.1 hypothetical protein [Falsiroseomonas algicola]
MKGITLRHAAGQLAGNAGGDAVLRLAQLGALTLGGWQLGPAGLAVAGLAWSIAAIAANVTQGGPEMAGTRAVALASGGVASAIRGTTALKLAATLAMLLLLGLVLALPVLLPAVTLPAGLGAQLLGQGLAALVAAWNPAWALRALGEAGSYGRVRALQGAILLATTWLFLSLTASPLALPAAEGVALLVAGLVAHRRLPALGAPAWHRGMLGAAAHLGVAGLLSSLLWAAPLLVGAAVLTEAELGLLAGALRLVMGLSGLLQMALQALYPLMARAFADDPIVARRATQRLTLAAAAATGLGAGLLAAAAPVLLPLALGPGFAEGVTVFRILLLLLLPIAIASPAAYALLACGEVRFVAWLQGVATAGVLLASIAAGFTASAPVMVAALHPALWAQAAATVVRARRLGAALPARCPGGTTRL